MKKTTFLFLLVFVASLGFAQIHNQKDLQMLQSKVQRHKEVSKDFTKKTIKLSTKANVALDEQFGSGGQYVITSDGAAGTQKWEVGTYTDCLASQMATDMSTYFGVNATSLKRYFSNYPSSSTDLAHGGMAWMNGWGNCQKPSLQQKNINSSIGWDNIDLSSFTNPARIDFYSFYYMFNSPKAYIEWTSDNWTTINKICLFDRDYDPNYAIGEEDELFSNDYTLGNYTAFLPLSANVPNVSIRFRFEVPKRSDNYFNGLFWFLDDVKITEVDGVDLFLADQAISFFDCGDYHTDPEHYIYGLSGYYGNIPKSYTETAAGVDLIFHAMYKNFGAVSTTGCLAVAVYLAQNNGTNWQLVEKIDSITVFANNPVAMLERDTIDAWAANSGIINLKNLEPGRYYVLFTILPSDGSTPIADANMDDNEGQFFFLVSQDELGLDTYKTDEIFNGGMFSTETQSWGENANKFTYIRHTYYQTETTYINGLYLYNDEDSDNGAFVEGSIQTWDPSANSGEGAWVEVSGSQFILEVDPSIGCPAGSWIAYEFPNPIEITGEAEYSVVMYPSSEPGPVFCFGEDARNNRNNEYYNARVYINTQGEYYVKGFTSLFHLSFGIVNPPETVTISGKVTEDGAPLQNIKVNYEVNGMQSSKTTNIEGKYSFTALKGAVVSIKPYSEFYTFSPESIVLGTVNVDKPNQDFAATWIGISTKEAANISVYPNPANTQITVANAENQTIEVLNVTGQVVARVNNATEIQVIDLSSLSNGSYFVKINGNVTHISIVK